MEDAPGEDPVGSSHQVAAEESERKNEQGDEYKCAWRVGYARMRAGEDNCLKHIRVPRAKENAVFLEEQSACDEFLFKAVRK